MLLGWFVCLHNVLLNNSFLTFWQLKFQKYVLILAGFLAGWARLAYINESRPGENPPFVWHIFQDIRLLALAPLRPRSGSLEASEIKVRGK